MIRQLTYIGIRIFDITTVHPSKTGDYSTEGVRFRGGFTIYVRLLHIARLFLDHPSYTTLFKQCVKCVKEWNIFNPLHR